MWCWSRSTSRWSTRARTRRSGCGPRRTRAREEDAMTARQLVPALALALSCGDNLEPRNDGGHDVPDAAAFPAPPALGAQIDRMGRPVINTALNAAFLPDTAMNIAMKKNAF